MFRGCEGPKPMKLLQSVEELSSVTGPIHLAIGVFDGIHLGHQSVINRASAAAARGGGTSVVLTFHPHPVRVLRPEKAPRLLTSTQRQRSAPPGILTRVFSYATPRFRFATAYPRETAPNHLRGRGLEFRRQSLGVGRFIT